MSETEHNLKDAELVRRAQGGRVDAFGRLYERYLDQIYRYIRSRVGQDKDAEDLTETVFIRSLESLATYQERGHPYSAFLYQVARNVLVDHYRSNVEEQALEDAAPLADGGPEPEVSIQQQQELLLVQRAMTRLPGDYQEVIRLRVVLSLPTATAAAWLDRSEGALRVLLYRALKALRREVERLHQEGD